MSAHSVTPGMPHLFRTYEAAWNQGYDCPIWQAARATTTSPFLFNPIRIGPPGTDEPFVNTSFGCNNPLDVILEEAYRVFPERHVSCVVSLGAGQFAPASTFSRDFTKFLVKLASNCEETANETELRFNSIQDVYFRFNVAHGLETVDIEDRDKSAVVKAQTDSYILAQEASQKMADAVKVIASRKISTAQLRTSIPA